MSVFNIVLYGVLLIGGGLLSVFLYARFRKIFRFYCISALITSIVVTLIGYALSINFYIADWLMNSPSLINFKIFDFLAGFPFPMHNDVDVYVVMATLYLFMITLAFSYFIGLFIILLFDIEQEKKSGLDKGGVGAKEHPKGLFREEDYWPYMLGVFVFAGLFFLPLIWGQFIYLSYLRLVAGSLIGCFVFAFAHKKDGQFSIWRFVGGLVFVSVMALKVSLSSGGFNGVIPGGLIGFLLMAGCGLLGIRIARLTGISKAYAKK